MVERSKNIPEPKTPKNKAQYNKLLKTGKALYKKQDFVNAIKYFNRSFDFNNKNPNVLVLLSDSLFQIGNKTAAMQMMMHALIKNPNDHNIANILGNAAMKMEFYDLAQKFHQKHIELKPDDVMGYNNYASALREDGKLDEAVTFLKDILPIFPTADILWNTLAAIIAFRDGPGEAIVFYEECLKINPKNTQALSNIAPAYASIGKLNVAEKAVREAIKLAPNLRDAHLFLSSLLLNAQKLDEGWKQYQHRPGPKDIKPTIKHNKIPYWRGENLKNKKILVFGEQGIGDEILFSWLYSQLIDIAGEVTISCEQRLVELFKTSFPTARVGATLSVIDKDIDNTIFITSDIETSDIDYQCLAGDLPMYFWKNYGEVKPNGSPILLPDEEKVDFWQGKLKELPHNISVGISWRSGIRQAKRLRNYARLNDWEPILKNRDINFINLQYGDCADELAEFNEKTGITIHNFKDLDLKDDFQGTTAMMKSLDLVLGPSSSPTMQSSFVGTETWYFTSGSPWWAFGDEIPIWRQNARILAKNENDPWPEFIKEKSTNFDKWIKKKTK